MLDIIYTICFLIFGIFGIYVLAKFENKQFEKKLKNDIEIVKLIIDELKK